MGLGKRIGRSAFHEFPATSYKLSALPDWDTVFIKDQELDAFAKALGASDELKESAAVPPSSSLFFTSLNDWKPIRQRIKRDGVNRGRKKRHLSRGVDETREGFVYIILKWPLLVLVLTWIAMLGLLYLITRLYVSIYETFVTIRGRREVLNSRMRLARNYFEWIDAAQQMDSYLGSDGWKLKDENAYYNSETIRNVQTQLRELRLLLDGDMSGSTPAYCRDIAEQLRVLVEAAVKDNFVGVENPKLYSETYYGTKNLVQSFVDELELSLTALSNTDQLSISEKADMFRHIQFNYGRTALCLSGGASFAYYHFGVAKALLDTAVLPQVITGTSGGALVAALLGTRTDAELKELLIPALAHKITACHDDFITWFARWIRTGARFDAVDWAQRCSWFCRGSLTFKEAFERSGRILNVTCIPSDPHSPTVLANHLTAPDCVIWSAVLASAAVPGILNPVVLMKKGRDGTISPYAFGNKWKDGSLRTDIPLSALNTHFNVNFPIVSQVNPHINLFFFNSRGTVGDPVTHRRGRGWRGGFLGSAIEQYLKLDLAKWVKVLRHLELLPRYSDTDWSEIYLQRFSGTVTIKPSSLWWDFIQILSDPSPVKLARMIRHGQQATWPKILFIRNRMKIESLIDQGREVTEPRANGHMRMSFSEKDLRGMLREAEHRGSRNGNPLPRSSGSSRHTGGLSRAIEPVLNPRNAANANSPSFGARLTRWISGSLNSAEETELVESKSPPMSEARRMAPDGNSIRRRSFIAELSHQSRVFFDDTDGGVEQDDSEADLAIHASTEPRKDEDPMDVNGNEPLLVRPVNGSAHRDETSM